MLKLKASLDLTNSSELAKVQAEHAARLKALEFDRTKTVADESRKRKADAQVLARVLSSLRPEGVITFLRDHDFGGSFDPEWVKPLHRFVDEANRPDHEFLLPELEALRLNLIEKGRVLSNLVALKTHRRDFGFQSVLPDSLVNAERPKHIIDAALNLNNAATDFVASYDELIRKARSEVQGEDDRGR
jgi:hypothetical protein